MAAGLAGALVSAIAWAAITASTGYQIGYVAIAVGFVVGFAIRIAGKGMDPIFGYIGAGLALLGCAVGNLLSVSYFVADELDLSFADFLLNLNVPLVVEMMKASFSPMDLLFYGLAIYAGYKFSFRQITQDELNELAAASA
ncbi:MAG: hypothetical protein DWQ31_05460 [Planctomycetota bacterium]|nr:MAG: hypothetical protein DWQ31_05460 [Planctomycetota bacterium]REJ93004.1 MAG: hypothetical protein DWQ35_11010 [Planctomycetota bacterium]REK30594.1 MAG: hypothetical protein DWQ42_01640 [Planctomycetota bacterium]REK46039.1 MAG: hypothetical protein DWQ46_07470 [Planctomycetota bacterium]